VSLPSLVAALVALPAIVGAILILITRTSLRNTLVVAGGFVVAAVAILTALAFSNTGDVFFGLPDGIALKSGPPGHRDRPDRFRGRDQPQVPPGRRPNLGPGQLGISLYLRDRGSHPRAGPGPRLLVRPAVAGHGVDHRRHRTAHLHQRHRLLRAYHRASPMIQGRRTVFFSLLFVFLAAMFAWSCPTTCR